MPKRLSSLPYLLIPGVLATGLYAPALFRGKTQIQGDSIIHSLSVLDFNRKLYYEGISPLWTDLLYGGHPYFAEGQGGFLNPLNIVVSLLFDPIVGQNFYHWLSIVVGALGMYFFCRQFRCSREASTFGALAVVFSSYWLQYHDNVTVSGALCWIPWVLLCFERWIEAPTGKSALWLALLVSILIFAGYPQACHGVIIYMAISLIPTLFSGCIGGRESRLLRPYLLTGLTAVAVCIGLSAVQWLPQLELATWSHRSGGTELFTRCNISEYLRGFLFTFFDVNVKTLSIGTVSSVFVCFISSLSLILKPNQRIIGHLLASIFLIILGMEYVTPLFAFMLKYYLVPGLKYFRIVHLYLGIAIVGLGLLCSMAIHHIQKHVGREKNRIKDGLILIAGGSLLFLVWLGLVFRFKSNDVILVNYVTFFAAYIGLIVLIVVRKTSWFGHMILFILVVEIAWLRLAPFPFTDPTLLEKPVLAKHIQTTIGLQDYKIMDLSLAATLGFVHPWSAGLEEGVRNVLRRLCPSTNVLWNVPSIGANLALPLARRTMIQPKMEGEIKGTDSTLPGRRLIDYLGVRYISTETVPPAKGLEAFMKNGTVIMENKHARPRIQAFTRYEIVESADEALNRLKQSTETTLILEKPFKKAADMKNLPVSTSMNVPGALKILSAKQANDAHRFEVRASQPAWLFIADANYPGWQANIDGQATAVYTAQVLGKAIWVPAAGSHLITVEYKPRSFTIGVLLLLVTLLTLLIVNTRRVYRQKKPIVGITDP